METDTTFVRADGIVMLYTVAHIGLYVAFIIYPSDAELVYTIRNTQTFNQVSFLEFGVFVVLFFDCT